MFFSSSLAVWLTVAAATAGDQPRSAADLVRQLDDPSFAVRQEADRKLRELGADAVPVMRQELRRRPTLEVARRLESIVRDQLQVRWHEALEPALAEARRTGKPLLAVSTLGKRDNVFARGGQELQDRTFTDFDVMAELSQNFVTVWQDALPEGWYSFADLIQRDLDRLPPAEDSYREGRGRRTVRSFFCTADGKLIHTLEGFWEPQRFLREARLARGLTERIAGVPESERIDRLRLELAALPEIPEDAVSGEAIEATLAQIRSRVQCLQHT